MTTSRPATRILGIRRVVVRAGSLYVMPPFKAAWCCQHVCGFRYADDMLPAGSTGSMRVLIVEGEPSAHRAHRPHPPAPRSADRGAWHPLVPRRPPAAPTALVAGDQRLNLGRGQAPLDGTAARGCWEPRAS